MGVSNNAIEEFLLLIEVMGGSRSSIQLTDNKNALSNKFLLQSFKYDVKISTTLFTGSS